MKKLRQFGNVTAVMLIVYLLGASGLARSEEERGSFGFAIEVDGEGFFLNPTVKSVTITSPGSPAARAGIAVRDQIVEADGHTVTGAKARDLEPLLKKQVGQILQFKLRRPKGKEYEATLIAVPRKSTP